MRPVDKGNRGAYKYHLTFDYSSETMYFLKQVFTTQFGTQYPTLFQCMLAWRNAAKFSNKQIKRPLDLNEIDAVADAFKQRIGDIYRQTTQPLLARLGDFCSYCETYLPGEVAVEHILPKAQYPDFCLDWENFLLCCKPCNIRPAKGDRPTRDTVVTDFMNGNQPQNEMEYYDEIRARYQWPDADDNTFFALLPRLEYYSETQKTWQPVLPERSVALDMRFINEDIPTRTSWAYIHVNKTGPLARRKVRVMIDAPNKASERTVELFKLNSTGKLTTVTDRRLLNRTHAWFDILEELDLLSQLPNDPLFELSWGLLLKRAVQKGFYSVWVHILNLSGLKDLQGQSLVTRFVKETNKANFFPNTRENRMPG